MDGLESRVPTDGSSNVHSMMLLAVNSVLTVELALVYGFAVLFVVTDLFSAIPEARFTLIQETQYTFTS